MMCTTDLLRELRCQTLKYAQVPFIERKQQRLDPLVGCASQALKDRMLQELSKIVDGVTEKRGKTEVVRPLDAALES